MSTDYEVSQGDTIPSIALDTGFFWETIWNFGENANLKSKRKNPNILYEGDIVKIPDLKTKSDSKATGTSYKYKRKGEPIKITIKLLKSDGKPRANEAYVLDLDGKQFKGNTDGDGQIKQKIPGDCKGGTLSLKDGKEVMPVQVGMLDPIDQISGVQHRLSNLGFDCDPTGELDDQTVRALQNFQAENNMQITDKIEESLKSKLLDLTQ